MASRLRAAVVAILWISYMKAEKRNLKRKGQRDMASQGLRASLSGRRIELPWREPLRAYVDSFCFLEL